MKTLIVVILGLAISVMVMPVEAQAGNDEALAAFVGFLGGAIVASAIADAADLDTHVSYRYGTSPRYSSHRYGGVRHGHYEWRRQRAWQPGRWVCSSRRYGRSRRVWQPGYYTWNNVQVWVSGRSCNTRSARACR